MSNRIESLNKENYDTWAIQAKAVLVKGKLWKYAVQQIDLKSASEPDIEGNLLAISELILIISPSELKQIKSCKTAHEIWIKLNETHASKCPARKATLLKQLILTKYEKGNDIREHLNNFMDVVDKLEEMNVAVHEDLLSIMMLYSLSSEYETFGVAIESRDNLPKPDELRIKIIEESQARKNTQGLQPSTSSSEQESFYAKTNLYCKICNKKGHMTKNCWKNYKNKNKNIPNNKGNRNKQNEFNSFALLAKDEAFQKQWILDSGCTSHMCYSKEYFSEIEQTNKTLKLASKDHNTNILGKGRVDLLLNTNKEIYLHNTLFIPDLCTNLLSIGKITDAGNTVLFKKDGAIVKKSKYGIVMKAKRTEDGLYAILPKAVINAKDEKVNFVKNNNISEWHSKLGHMNFKDMQLALKNESLIGLDFKLNEQPEECEVCIKAKMKATIGKPRTEPRTSEPLQIVHSDVCGPMSKASCAGNKYFVTFIDDFTRYSRVFCIKTKNLVLDMFKVYKAEVENFMEKKIKCLQSDNGTEYCNNEFNNFLKENGITRRLSAPYTPHQNGIAERKNRTLLEKARSLMIESNAPMYLWGEAIYTANYLSNRSPNNSIGNATPFEKWVGRKPCVAHLNKFGAKAFILLKGKQNISKFDAKAIPGVFIGYSEISKAFRIWVPSTQKVIVTKNVNIMQKFYYDISEGENFSKSNKDETIKEKEYVEIEFLEQNKNREIQESSEREEDIWVEAEMQTGSNNDSISEENEIHSAEEEELPQNEITVEQTETRALRDHSLIRKPLRFDDFVMNAVAELENNYTEPETYNEAISSENRDKWEEAMQSEMNSLQKNNTWELTALPKGRKALPSKWIYKIKKNPDGTIERYKARLVIKGFSQREGIDYDKTFSPVARLVTIRAILGNAANENLNLQQFDVTTAFLNGTVDEEIYMAPPNGLDVPKGKVCRLLRSLYGLKQAPRCWNECIHKFLIDAKFQRSEADPCLYVRIKENSKVIVGLYVDDGLVASTDSAGQEFLNELKRKFKIKTKPASYFLGMEINQNNDGSINLRQTAYAKKILKRFGMENCKPVSSPAIKMPKMEETNENEDMKFPYRNCVGALAYLMVATRPDICYAVSVASRHLENPSKEDIVAVKRILRFLKGTLDKGLTFYPMSKFKAHDLMCYSDADHGGDPETGHSTTGIVCLYAGTAIAWKSQKQTSVALSTTEAELVAASEATQEIVWLKKLLADLSNTDCLKVTLCIDNESAVKLSYNPPYEFHRRTKHISLRHFFIREKVSKGELVVKQVAAQVQLADMFTKPLYGPRFNELSRGIGLRTNS